MDSTPAGAVDVFVVWIPMLPSDHLDAARSAAGMFAGTGARQFWDGEGALGSLVAHSVELGLVSVAWDIYLLYGPESVFTAETPVPIDWVHQLSRAPRERYRGGRIEAAVRDMVQQHIAAESGP